MRTSVLGVALSMVATVSNAQSVRLVEDLRLDATAEDFPAVTAVFVGPRGQIAVPLFTDMQVRLFDSTGRSIATIGRRGSGPGEFRDIGRIGWIGDTMWVLDPRQQRTVFIGPGRQHLRTEAWPPATNAGSYFFAPAHVYANGAMYGQEVPSRSGTTSMRSADGKLSTVTTRPERPSVTYGGFGFSVPLAFQAQVSIAPDGSRLVEAMAPILKSTQGSFVVRARSMTGDTVFSRTFHHEAEPIPKATYDSALARVIPAPGHLINTPADLQERITAMARAMMPTHYAGVEGVIAGLDRTTWIARRPANGRRPYLVLDGRGDSIGTVVVPVSTVIRQASALQAWATETDRDGLSSVIRFRLTGLRCRPSMC